MLAIASNNLAQIDPNFPARLFHSKTFIQGMNFDAITCNWTLHFIQERSAYLTAMFESLKPDGLLILTEKTQQSPTIEHQYIEFKRNNGLSDIEIDRKNQQLEGVLIPLSVTQNIQLLNQVGFSQIEVMHARLGFVTFLCIKS